MKKIITIIALISAIAGTTMKPASVCSGRAAYDAFVEKAKAFGEKPKERLKEYRSMFVEMKETQAFEKYLKKHGTTLSADKQKKLEDIRDIVKLSEGFFKNIREATKWKICQDATAARKALGEKMASGYLSNIKRLKEMQWQKAVPKKSTFGIHPKKLLQEIIKREAEIKRLSPLASDKRVLPLWEWELIK